MTALNHLAATATVAEVTDALSRDNYVIIDELVPEHFMDALQDELDPFVESSPVGAEAHLGTKTRRTGALVARSPLSHRLIRHPTILGTVEAFLAHASAYQLMLTQVISIYPGEKAQGLHQDENAWDYFPFPADYHVQCNTLWALSDYTAEMGATAYAMGYYRDVEDPIVAVRGDGYGDRPGADVSAINPRARAALDKLIASKTA